MKWWEILGVIVAVGVLIQLLNWTFGFVNIENEPLRFLISTIYALLIVIILIQYQTQDDIRKMKDFLNNKEFVDYRNKMFNKKGIIDPRILWIILALVILYLLWKSNLFG